MSQQPNTRPEDQEIDLSNISRRVGNAFQSLNTYIFTGIQFVIRNIRILSLLVILGIALGFYLDKTQKVYDHQIIVRPNFGSVDYLYSTVGMINAKIMERDVSFLNSIGIKNPSKLVRIEIDPIVDIYPFINNSSTDQNLQLFKLMAEDGEISNIVEDPTTSKNFPFHAISFTTRDKTSHRNTIQPLLNYLNNTEYFKKVQAESVRNVKIKMDANEQIITQIDNFLNGQSGSAGASKSSMVYINENTQLNDVINTKEKLIQEQGQNRIELVVSDKIIKDITIVSNIENRKAVQGKLKLVLPVIFVLLFLVFRLIRAFYRSQKLKLSQQAI